MNTKATSDIDPSLNSWAKKFCQERRSSIEYLQRFGGSIEKALVNKVIELSQDPHT